MVYIDRVFVLNTIIDYLLLLTTAQLIGAELRRYRFILAALVGGLYAAATFAFPWTKFPPIRFAVGILLPGIAFWGMARLWRHISLFFLLSGAFAGILLAIGLLFGSATTMIQRVYYADISYPVLILSAIIFYLALQFLFRQEARFGKGELMDILVSFRGNHCRVRALYDTGNTLRNPVDGSCVLVAEIDALLPLWREDIRCILKEEISPEEKLTLLYQKGETAFSLLPYSGIGEEHGLLLAIRSDYIQIGRRICPKTLVALYQKSIGTAAYQALWGGKGREDETACRDTALDTPTQVG